MKRSTAFTLIFLISSITGLNACVDYYPYGEDLRFTIFSPRYFGFKDLGFFYYSGHYYSEPDTLAGDKSKMTSGERLNVDLWRTRCRNVPSVQSVYDAIYGDEYFLDSLSTNPFIHYLVAHKDAEAFQYLGFAKNSSFLADNIIDPWERNQDVYLPQRTKEINGALRRARETKDEFIRTRYAFLAIRMAYYNNSNDIIRLAYAEFFEPCEKKNIIDYWAMHFRALVEAKGAKRNYLAAQVFTNAPDKRWAISDCYDRQIPVAAVLQYAKTKKEKAAVWFLAGIRNPGRAMESLMQMYSLKADPDGLSFLLVREVNKLEDWIYTPYYTKYDPAVGHGLAEDAYSTESKTKKRIRSDRAYAKELLAFVEGSAANKNVNQLAWKMSRAYLFFMTQNDSAALEQIATIKTGNRNKKELEEQVEMIRALCLIHIQPDSAAIIPAQIETLLLREAKAMNYKFIFAVARELEFKSNRTDAAILVSKLNAVDYDYEHRVGWKKKQGRNYWFNETYEDYFSYIDAVYATEDIGKMIAAIEANAAAKDTFGAWKYSTVKKDLPRLYDLMGTKYMRENKLQQALQTFEKVNDTLWTSKYTAFSTYLDANPFYTDMYNEHKKTFADTIRYNKESITRTLIGYLAKAEDVTNKDRDYYYFLVANCYFNMSQYGNSWMMKRYGWGSSDTDGELLDDKDYSGCDIAKRYYLKAKSVSKRKKFAALCLRMAGRCEKYRLWHAYNKKRDWSDSYEKVRDSLFAANKYYNQLQKSYPAYYDDLISNCYSFERYFQARR